MRKKYTLLTLAVIGILISAYLFYAKLTDNPLVCGASLDCNTVQKSEYSTLLGIPLGFWGMFYYFMLFTAFYVATTIKIKVFRTVWLIWGLLFSLYLTALEAFVIEAYCIWCLASFANIVLLNLIYFLWKDETTRRPSKSPAANMD
jgi:uncharacterized membrane protein